MNIIQFIRNNPNSRKIFGKREIEIIEKQIFGIRLTPSERNRLSRDIRKKFEFIKEISGYNFDLDLKKGSEIKEKIEEIKQEILKSQYYRRIKRIIVYGSTIYGIRTFRSDIDIAVEFEDIDLKEATKFRIKFGYDKRMDVQVYNVLPNKIKKEIDEKGRVIYERSDKRQDY
jgi:predicted nucleotidyltransferase